MFSRLFYAVEDLERNDGSPEKPYYMSKDLMKILGKKNVKENKREAEENGNGAAEAEEENKV